MKIADILKTINIGSIAAEDDPMLDKYFIQTTGYNELLNGGVDFILGNKGTGKSAIYEYISKNYKNIPELKDKNVEIVQARNPKASIIFQRVKNFEVIDEEGFISLWKWYIFWVVGNAILEIYKGRKSRNIRNLEYLLLKLDIKKKDVLAGNTFFGKVKRMFSGFGLNNLEFELSYNPLTNNFSLSSKIRTDEKLSYFSDKEKNNILPDDAMAILNDIVSESGNIYWVIFDKLDVIFPIYSLNAMNYSALKGLLRMYIEFRDYNGIGLKFFMRRDYFSQISHSYLTGNTNISARRYDIDWNEEDLRRLLVSRIKSSDDFVSMVSSENIVVDDEFTFLFPRSVEDRKTWNWIISHITDGMGVISPRNIIDITNRAILNQKKYDDRDFRVGIDLIEAKSLKKAFLSLSEQRLEDTLLCENPLYSDVISRFTNQKYEHDKISLNKIINPENDKELDEVIKYLKSAGFLNEQAGLYRIPLLYRAGLNIKSK